MIATEEGQFKANFDATPELLFWHYAYGPFGEVIRATGPLAKANPFRFSTKYQDDESDLLYYGYRYYTASEGRWLNRDPLQEKGGLNLYEFCQNDSLDKLDKDGRVVLVDDSIILAVVGTIAACAAAEAWIHSPAGDQAMHNIAASAASIADAIAEATKEALRRCNNCKKGIRIACHVILGLVQLPTESIWMVLLTTGFQLLIPI